MTAVVFNPTRVVVPERELLLAPRLQRFLRGDGLPDPIPLTLSGHTPRRHRASGWFSPSTHPTMTARQLYHYAADPEHWDPPEFDDTTKVSALMGTIFHEIVNIAFEQMGILVPPPEAVCPLCSRPRGRTPGADTCNEWAVTDPVLMRRGHMDDVVDLPGHGRIGVDVKTASPESMNTIRDHDLSIFTKPTELKAKYYAQVQEYMALTDTGEFMLLFISMGRPWAIREIIVPRDQDHIDHTLAKYRLVRDAVERGAPPEACCKGSGARFDQCPATRCPVKLV